MKQLLTACKRILTGEEILTQKTKLKTLVIASLIVHAVLVELFSVFSVFPLVIYNILIVAFYVSIYTMVKQEKYTLGYILTFIELVVQAVLCDVLIGWQAGFALFLICIVPIVFYMVFSIASMKRRLIIPIIITFIVLACYIGMYIYGQTNPPKFVISESAIRTLYIYNIVVVFLMLASLSFFYVLETIDSQQTLTQQNQSLEHTASVDQLTGLYNRHHMAQVLAQTMERAKQRGTLFSLVMGDIDNFKRINDTYGHECGDKALVHVAKIMESCVREGDVVCRWGGEEFLILVTGNIDNAVIVGERIRATIEENVIEYQGTQIPFTMTLGVSTYVPGYKMETLIKQADERLYDGKMSGKNKVVA